MTPAISLILMSRIRFASTTGPRFGANVVRREGVAGTAFDAARGGRTQGVSAYAPNDAPSAGDIPDRGEAAFRGSAVAGAPVTARTQEGGDTLRREEIDLVSSFTRMRVEDTRTANGAEPGVFSVRFIDDAGEALGVWGAFDIEAHSGRIEPAAWTS